MLRICETPVSKSTMQVCKGTIRKDGSARNTTVFTFTHIQKNMDKSKDGEWLSSPFRVSHTIQFVKNFCFAGQGSAPLFVT